MGIVDAAYTLNEHGAEYISLVLTITVCCNGTQHVSAPSA